jgi:DNA-binding MarR family transcriptional regulator
MDGRPSAIVRQSPVAEMVSRLAFVESTLLTELNLRLGEEQSSFEQWHILEVVSLLDGPTMGELALASGMPNASLSRIVDALEDSASVFRRPTTTDRRRIAVYLSRHGEERLIRMRDIVAAWEQSIEATIGADALASLASAAMRVENRLRSQ